MKDKKDDEPYVERTKFSETRLLLEIKRLRGVIRSVTEVGLEEECELCWSKKDQLREGIYPKE